MLPRSANLIITEHQFHCERRNMSAEGGDEETAKLKKRLDSSKINLFGKKLRPSDLPLLTQRLRDASRPVKSLTLCFSASSAEAALPALVSGENNKNSALTYIDLAGNFLQDEPIGDLLRACPALAVLSLYWNRIDDAALIKMTPALAEHPCLQKLYLQQNKLTDACTEALAGALSRNRVLQTLNISDNKIGPLGAKALARADKIPLKNLFLARNDIGDEGAAALAASAGRWELEAVDVSDNRIERQGGLALLAFFDHAPLRPLTLDVSSNRLYDDFVDGLCEKDLLLLFPMTLQMNDVDLTGKGMARMARWLAEKDPPLKMLDLQNNARDIQGEEARVSRENFFSYSQRRGNAVKLYLPINLRKRPKVYSSDEEEEVEKKNIVSRESSSNLQLVVYF